jgi:glutathione S-transferase
MIRLYDSRLSGNAWKVRLLFARLGIAYERRTLDLAKGEARTPELLALNRLGRIPIVVLEDGRPLFESNAILLHFAEGTPLVPEDRYLRSQVHQWMFFEQYDHVRYLARARFLITVAKKAAELGEEIATLQAMGRKALEAMERHLVSRDFFVGEGSTVADYALFPYTSMAAEGGYDLGAYPAVTAWLGRMRAEPDYEPLMQK